MAFRKQSDAMNPTNSIKHEKADPNWHYSL